MPFVIYANATRPLKADKETWIHMQADANCRGKISREPPQIFEEYHAARGLGLPPGQAWETAVTVMRQKNGVGRS